ncbi:MAG: hypothetical protein ACR2PT_22315 [Endozoicomonas sp.]
MRREDKTINEIPDLAISADDRPERRRQAGNSGRAPAKTREPGGGGKGFSWFLLILIIALASGGGWQFLELQKELSATRQELVSAHEKLSNVTGEVTATGKNLDQSGSAMRSELKVLDSEIRKLWDVSNKRNRQWIVINKDNIVKVTRTADKTAEEVKKVQGQVKNMDQMVKAITTEQVAAQSEVTASLDTLIEQMKALKAQLAQQQTRQDELDKMIVNQQDAVKSMDLFRQQVNRKLQQLESTVRDFTLPPQQGLGLQ